MSYLENSNICQPRFVLDGALGEAAASAKSEEMQKTHVHAHKKMHTMYFSRWSNTHMESRSRHPRVGISVGSWVPLVVNADADTVRVEAAWKSKALINTDDSAPFHKSRVSLCVYVCVCRRG